MSRQQHWETVYANKPADTVSWYQPHAERSLQLVRDSGLPLSASIIDVGGGASTLVDDLLGLGYSALTVLDISAAAMTVSRARLGPESSVRVHWLEADICAATLTHHGYDAWHDRAVFHFLTDAEDRAKYVRKLTHALKPGGHLFIATFAEEGPERCSGLPVVRYSATTLGTEFGSSFELLWEGREQHRTPGGAAQTFQYCHFRRKDRP